MALDGMEIGVLVFFSLQFFGTYLLLWMEKDVFAFHLGGFLPLLSEDGEANEWELCFGMLQSLFLLDFLSYLS